MKKNKNAYVLMAENMLPRSSILKDCVMAFLIGGVICCIGQAFSDIYSSLCGLSQELVKMLVPSTLVFFGGLLTGIGVYDDIGKVAGAGSVVPITGFANSIVSCAVEYKREGYVFGVGAKMFTIAGPVLVYGISASVVCGFIYWLCNVI